MDYILLKKVCTNVRHCWELQADRKQFTWNLHQKHYHRYSITINHQQLSSSKLLPGRKRNSNINGLSYNNKNSTRTIYK